MNQPTKGKPNVTWQLACKSERCFTIVWKHLIFCHDTEKCCQVCSVAIFSPTPERGLFFEFCNLIIFYDFHSELIIMRLALQKWLSERRISRYTEHLSPAKSGFHHKAKTSRKVLPLVLLSGHQAGFLQQIFLNHSPERQRETLQTSDGSSSLS